MDDGVTNTHEQEALEDRLDGLVTELYELLCLRAHGCTMRELSSDDVRWAIVEWAEAILDQWQEQRVFDSGAFEHPGPIAGLLFTYSNLATELNARELAMVAAKIPAPRLQ
jgi:hypothetical protein